MTPALFLVSALLAAVGIILLRRSASHRSAGEARAQGPEAEHLDDFQRENIKDAARSAGGGAIFVALVLLTISVILGVIGFIQLI